MNTTATKYAYLKMVTEENNNKMYEMVDNGDGTWTAYWGRMTGNKDDDRKSAQSKVYDMSKWDSTFNSKVKKGYKDYTSHQAEKTLVENKTTNSKGNTVISNDAHVADIIAKLQAFAKAQTAAVYKVEAVGVTQMMIDDAQKVIDNMNNILKTFGTPGWSMNLFNKELLELFGIIPRKMTNVRDHLIDDKATQKSIESLLSQEQSNIDAMAGQVAQRKAANTPVDDSTVKAQTTLLDNLGLSMKQVTDQAILDKVKKLAEQHSHRVQRVFEVTNNATQKAFDAHLAQASNKKTVLYWHGSRRQNWWFIVQQGLRIRPSGAIHNGSMFGDGIYFASECDKSMGYTDGGCWTGSNNTECVYMALYEVHLGKQYETLNSDWSLSASKLKTLGNYDSTWGKKGPNLHRHEYIVYNSAQSTIKYLIEFKN